MRKRVVEYWHPDNSSIEICRKPDKQLTAQALLSPGDSTGLASDLIDRSFPQMWRDRSNFSGDLTFNRSEAPIVVNRLIDFARICYGETRPLDAFRATSLIGHLVVVAYSPIIDPKHPLYPRS